MERSSCKLCRRSIAIDDESICDFCLKVINEFKEEIEERKDILNLLQVLLQKAFQNQNAENSKVQSTEERVFVEIIDNLKKQLKGGKNKSNNLTNVFFHK